VSQELEAVKQATVTIDTQLPTGSPVDPGSILRGTVTLSDPSPADAGGGVGSVAFEYSVHGANSWTAIGTRTSAPWAVLFDTTAVPDGQYDLREVISDAAVPPNVTTIDLPGPQLIDNTPPAVRSSPRPPRGVRRRDRDARGQRGRQRLGRRPDGVQDQRNGCRDDERIAGVP
jgi:hypothetical protein